MTDFSETREFYHHDPECDPKVDVGPPNDRGLRACQSCAGTFQKDGITGVAITSTKFDEGPRDPRAWNGDEDGGV